MSLRWDLSMNFYFNILSFEKLSFPWIVISMNSLSLSRRFDELTFDELSFDELSQYQITSRLPYALSSTNASLRPAHNTSSAINHTIVAPLECEYILSRIDVIFCKMNKIKTLVVAARFAVLGCCNGMPPQKIIILLVARKSVYRVS